MSQSTFDQPPRIAVWLINLFTTAKQEESILGDLLEEFSNIASTSGNAAARRWYWRQSINTIAHLFGGALREEPWTIAGFMAGGVLLNGICATLRMKFLFEVFEILTRSGLPISNSGFSIIRTILVQILPPILVGSVVALIAKGKEMVVSTGLSVAILTTYCAVWVSIARYSPSLRFHLLPIIIPSFAIFIGGLVVRETRAARHSTISSNPIPS